MLAEGRRIFGRRPKPRAAKSFRAGHYKDLTETGNRAKKSLAHRAELFEGRLALNSGLKLTRVSLSCVQKHFLG